MKKQINFTAKAIFFTFLMAIIMSACQKEDPIPKPVAGFSFEPNNVEAPATVQFTNMSENAESYSWDFGDNSAASTAINPSHAYPNEGSFIVVLSATGEDGTIDVAQQTVDILPPPEPVAVFSMSALTADAPAEITFTNESLNADTYIWDFGDGGSSTDENPFHVFTDPGEYTIQLTATGYGGSNTSSKELTVTVPVNIFPGVGAGGYELSETWGSVKDKFTVKNLDYKQYGPIVISGSSGSVTIHPIEVKSAGLFFYFVSVTGSMTLKKEDKIFLIALDNPFIGITDMQIGLGSLLSEVKTAYGEPEKHDTQYHYYRYYSLGVNFRYVPATGKVDTIVLFTKTSSNSRMDVEWDDIVKELERMGL